MFRHNDYYIIVGSEPANFLVILGGIMPIYFVLLLVMIPVLRSIFKKIILYQKWEAVSDQERFMTRKKYPPLRDFFEDFLIAVFMLSAVLFISTRGNPVGLTYNIVRGTWRRGVNAATVTTCIMLVSVVFAVLRMMSLFFLKMSEYLSPRSVTICQLFISVMRYFGTAVAVGVFLIFEGDFTIGDMIVVDGFRGIVTDISIRTTKLQDEHTRDVRIINNSKIVSLTNQSREKSAVIVDVTINPTVDIRKMEEVLMEKVKALPQRFPEIIGEPEYWGISKLPEWQPRGAIGDYKARIVFYCQENDRRRYQAPLRIY